MNLRETPHTPPLKPNNGRAPGPSSLYQVGILRIQAYPATKVELLTGTWYKISDFCMPKGHTAR